MSLPRPKSRSVATTVSRWIDAAADDLQKVVEVLRRSAAHYRSGNIEEGRLDAIVAFKFMGVVRPLAKKWLEDDERARGGFTSPAAEPRVVPAPSRGEKGSTK